MKKLNLLSKAEMKQITGGIISREVLEELCNYWGGVSFEVDPNASPEVVAIVENMSAEMISRECEVWAHGGGV